MAIRFSGHVQGVGFRATARSCAATRRVSGWVRNETDGSVLMEIQGEQAEAETVLNLLRERMGARITGEERTNLATIDGESEFLITR